MASFLYFFPAHTRPVQSPDQIPVESVKTLLQGASLFGAPNNKGPGDTTGALISVQPVKGGTEARCWYKPEEQQWHEVKDRDGKTSYWIGWEKAAKPEPKDLLRPKSLDGHPVTLADGNEWIIPAVHANKFTTLPMGAKLLPNGEMEMTIVPGYEQLTERAAVWFDLYWQKQGFPTGEFFRYAWDLLAVNYRVGPVECGADVLNLVTHEAVMVYRIIEASLGVPALMEELEAEAKKKTEEGTQPSAT